MLIHPGVQTQILNVAASGAGTTSRDFSIQSDAVLLTLYAGSVSGALDVVVYAVGPLGTVLSPALVTFATQTGPTPQLLIERSGVIPGALRVVATYNGACEFEVNARAVFAGTSDTRILGSTNWEVSQVTVGTSPVLLIPAALTDRQGLLVKNWSSTQTIYVGESAAKAAASVGYPLAPRDAIAMDVASGSQVYAVSDAAGADARIVQAGG